MQRIPLSRSLLTELLRCDRAFIMSLYYHNLDNEHLANKGGVEVDNSDAYAKKQAMLLDLERVREAVDLAGGVTTVECETNDLWEKVRMTDSLVDGGGPLVIVDGAIENNWLTVGFAAMIVEADGGIELYHLSTSSFDGGKSYDSNATKALKNVAPLMLVASEKYGERLRKVAVIGIDKSYITPYPDPVTGEIVVDPDDILCEFSFEGGVDVSDYTGDDNPAYLADALQAQVGQDPSWLPDAQTGSQCNYPYTCAFKTFCKMNTDPDDVVFHFEKSDDVKVARANGYALMSQVLDASYDYPTLENIPSATEPGMTFDLSEIALRDLRLYEDMLYG